ncbi:MAG: type II secretion system protein GspG [Planctomycetes bacterium]|nr:type II secretion system protein GspG [Planctomycetota bacterium]
MELKPILRFTGGALTIIALGALVLLFVIDKPDSDSLSRWRKAHTEMGEIQKALNQYSLDHNDRYPESLDALQEEYLKSGVPKNPFSKQPYGYLTNGERFVLICYGHDGLPGGEEDMDSDIVYTEAGYLKLPDQPTAAYSRFTRYTNSTSPLPSGRWLMNSSPCFSAAP